MNKEDFANSIFQNEEAFYRISKTVLYSDADCEDAIHNAILKAYEHLYQLRNEEFFKTWFIRILLNECYKISREKSKYTPVDTVPEEFSDNRQDYSELYNAIVKLPKGIKAAVVLYYIEDMSIEQTARVLRIPKGTVKSRLYKGRIMLKELLEEK